MAVLKIRDAADGSWISLGGFPSTSDTNFVLDEDDMASDSASHLATQQSIKAYTDNSIAALDTPGLVWIETDNLSSSANSSSTGWSTAYDAVLVVLSQVVPATDAVDLLCQVQSGGTWRTTTNYDYGMYIITNAGGTGTSADNDGTAWNLTAHRPVGSAAGEFGFSGQVWIHGLNASKDPFMNWRMSYWRDDGYLSSGWGGGSNDAASSRVTGVLFKFAAGNIESGTITYHYIRAG